MKAEFNDKHVSWLPEVNTSISEKETRHSFWRESKARV